MYFCNMPASSPGDPSHPSARQLLDFRVGEQKSPALLREALDADFPAAHCPRYTAVERLVGFQFARIGLHVRSNELVILRHDRSKPVPVEPLLREFAHVAQVSDS